MKLQQAVEALPIADLPTTLPPWLEMPLLLAQTQLLATILAPMQYFEALLLPFAANHNVLVQLTSCAQHKHVFAWLWQWWAGQKHAQQRIRCYMRSRH